MTEYQVVDKTALDADLLRIGDSIRDKSGTTELFTSASAMASSIQLLPDYELMKQIIDGTLVELVSDSQLFTTIGVGRFAELGALTVVNAPAVMEIEISGFSNNPLLQSIKLQNCRNIDMGGFSQCASMTEVWLPKARRFEFGTFEYCTSLETLTLPSAEWMHGWNFDGCEALRSLILPNKIVCVAENDPTINPDCSIYVPKGLIEQYKVATNWSLYADQFLAIEDHPEIGGQL